mgnify:CR=1 FL=1
MTVVSLNDLFKLALLRREFIEVGIWLSVFGIHLIQAFQRVNHFGYRFFYRLTYGLLRVELRLLRQVADFDARLRTRFTFDVFTSLQSSANVYLSSNSCLTDCIIQSPIIFFKYLNL